MTGSVYLDKFLLIRDFDHTLASSKKQLKELLKLVEAQKSSLNDTFDAQYVIAKFQYDIDCDSAMRTLTSTILDGEMRPLRVQHITREQLNVHNRHYASGKHKKKGFFKKLFTCSAGAEHVDREDRHHVLDMILAAEPKFNNVQELSERVDQPVVAPPVIQRNDQVEMNSFVVREELQDASAAAASERRDSRFGERTLKRHHSHHGVRLNLGQIVDEKVDEMDYRIIRQLSMDEVDDDLFDDTSYAQRLQDEEYAQYLQDLESNSNRNSSHSRSADGRLDRIRSVPDVILSSAAAAQPVEPRQRRISHYSNSSHNLHNHHNHSSSGQRRNNSRPASSGRKPQGGNPNALDMLHSFTVTDSKMTTESCTICMDNYEMGEKVVPLPCLHFFHKNCVSKWLASHQVCPLCRAAV
jgi:hypothetical protein